MQVSYFEAIVLARIPRAGEVVTLDDFHKFAWSVFAGNGQPSAEPGVRPFLFRVEACDERRHLVTVRSEQSFPGAREKRLVFEAGDKVAVDCVFLPRRRKTIRPCDPSSAGGKGRVQVSVTPRSEQWANIGEQRLAQAGLEVDKDRVSGEHDLFGYFQLAPGNAGVMPMVNISREATVVDEMRFGGALLDGVGAKRGYGYGMLRLTPASLSHLRGR